MPLLNYTTAKDAQTTITEIQQILAQYDVSGIMTEFEGRNVSAVSFKMDIKGQTLVFKLPCNWRSVQAVLTAQNAERGYRRSHTTGRSYKEKPIDDSDEHSIRVAWRIIKDWVQAQMALVEVNMATVQQVFLPYAMTRDGRTLAEKIAEDPQILLGSGE